MISGLEPSPFDSPVVARLKQEALRKLAGLPEDPGERARVLGSKVDYFAASSLRIRPKETEGGLAPFSFNPIQMDYLAGLRLKHRLAVGTDQFQGIRDIILKPRQLGFTTFIAAMFFFDGLFRPGRNTLVLTHLDKVSQKVLEIYRAFYDSLPVEIKKTVRLRRASALHLELEFLDENGLPDPVRMPPSSFIVHTAAGFDLRGITVHNLHCSEAAFYENWIELVRGVFQAVPASGNIVLESTANGFNHFKDLVDTALRGEGAYRLVFYPWFAHPEYTLPLTREEAEILEASLTHEERLLRLEHNVGPLALAWRRQKLAEMVGSLDSFRQEYPGNIMDAFISSGRPVFDLRVVAENWDLAKKARVLEARDEHTTIFAAPEPDGVYLVCADPAEGIDKGEGNPAAEIGGTDYSSGFVLDVRTLRTMASVHGRLEPPDFARRLALLGYEFNNALLAVERNNHGGIVLYALEESGYPNLYRHMEYDAAGQQFLKLGFPTTITTRPLVIDALREVVRRNALPCSDQGFWREAMTFVFNPAGKAEAMPTRHDDRIMSKAIGVYLCTLGAKAWGGVGYLRGADGAGLPLGQTSAAPSPLSPQNAPEAAPAVPQAHWGSVLGSTLSTAFSGQAPAPQAPAPTPANPEPQAAPHEALSMLAEARAVLHGEGTPRCRNCQHWSERNGQGLCALQGWMINAADPACGAWEPPVESYNEAEVQRFQIGGVQ